MRHVGSFLCSESIPPSQPNPELPAADARTGPKYTTPECTRSVPTNSARSDELRYPPSDWLRTGYAPVTFPDGSTGWERLNAYQLCAAYGRTANPDEIAAFYAGSAAQELFKRLALTFGQFFPLNAGQWEADLRGTPNPITHLYLWQTAADVFTYYMTGKRSQQRKVLSPQARQEYLSTLWLFFHHGHAAAACQERHLRAEARAHQKRRRGAGALFCPADAQPVSRG